MKYYRILDDLSVGGRWFVGEIELPDNVDVWRLVSVSSTALNVQFDLVASVKEDGVPLDLTMGEFEVLIANEKVANVFNENEVEKIPLIIPGYEERQHYIIVIKKEYDYIDRERSDFTIWEEGNLIRPDLTGTYKSFFKMVIDPGLAHGKRIFRVENFNVAIIVNEEIKKAFQELEIKGVVFKEV